MTRRISVRLTEDQAEHLEYESLRRKQNKSDVVREMLEESMRTRRCPGITFIDSPSGRQATVAGTGLAVWEIVRLDREVEGCTGKILEVFPQLSERDLRNVRAYASLYPDEVDKAVREADALDEAGARNRYPYLFPPGETP